MECSNTKCLKPDNDRMVTCWLCFKYYHLKCSGSNLRTRDPDALADSQKFLSWTCVSCRNVGIEFYSPFKNSKADFEKINKEFISLQSRLTKFGELFTNFNNLDKFMNALQNMSPKQKKKNVKSVSSQCSLTITPTSNKVTQSVHINSELISEPSPMMSIPATDNTDLVMKHLDCSSQTLTLTPVAPIKNYGSNTDSIQNAVNGNNVLGNNKSIAPEVVSPRTALNNEHSVPKTLKIIPPRKSIFISRFAFDTTPDDINYYLNTKISDTSNIYIKKFNYSRPRNVTSFKLTVPPDYYETILQPSFWPLNTYVREYTEKNYSNSSKIVKISSNSNPAPKN